MLVLTRRHGEAITVGDDILITIVSVEGQHVRVGVKAPRSVPIYRSEVQERIKLENRRAAQATQADVQRLASVWKPKAD